MKVIYKLKLSFLFLFLTSLPFEYWDPFGISSYFTITKFIGLSYFLLSLLDFRNNFKYNQIKSLLIPLSCIYIYYVLQGFNNPTVESINSVFYFTLVQNIVLFWLVSNDIIRNPKIISKLFLSIIVGTVIMGVLIYLRIGVDPTYDLGYFRVSFFGSNPNNIGDIVALSIFLIGYLIIKRREYFGRTTWLLIFLSPLLVAILGLTGSRGALLTLFGGILIFILLQKGKRGKRYLYIIVGICILYVLFDKLIENNVMDKRITNAIEEKNLGGRDIIWKESLQIFYENPVFGISRTGYKSEIKKRIGEYLDTHNILLYFMVTGGIIGLILYSWFLLILYKKAYSYYSFFGDSLLLSILVIYFIIAFKSGGAIESKLLWFLTSVITGIGTNNLKKVKETNLIKNNDRSYTLMI